MLLDHCLDIADHGGSRSCDISLLVRLDSRLLSVQCGELVILMLCTSLAGGCSLINKSGVDDVRVRETTTTT